MEREIKGRNGKGTNEQSLPKQPDEKKKKKKEACMPTQIHTRSNNNEKINRKYNTSEQIIDVRENKIKYKRENSKITARQLTQMCIFPARCRKIKQGKKKKRKRENKGHLA